MSNLLDFIDIGIFKVEDNFIKHPLINDHTIEAREFQIKIARKALFTNTLVVLPTGLGKTIIAALVAAEILRKEGKVLFLAPTRPLVLQHYTTFKKLLKAEMMVFTGKIKPALRKEKWEKARVFFSTPQLIKNDLEKERYNLQETKLLIVDEAHRAIGKYAYVPIAKRYVKKGQDSLILALTASPGGDRKKIKQVLENLNIKQVEARNREDEDVKNYIQKIKISWRKVSLTPEQESLRKILNDFLREKIEKIQTLGLVTYKNPKYVSRKDLIEAGEQIRKKLSFSRRKGYLFGLLHNQSLALLSYHCLELLETQGNKPLHDYLRRLFTKGNLRKGEISFIKDERIRKVYSLLDKLVKEKVSHPKLNTLLEVVEKQLKEKENSLILIFSQYRDTINSILEELKKIPSAKPIRFVGQSSREEEKGLSQDEQKEILEKFKEHYYNILVASSVAEEGIDVPNVDLVVFYEPIPSEIRAIQRKGRTGRTSLGKVVILVTENSRDVAYLQAERKRKEKMWKVVNWLKSR